MNPCTSGPEGYHKFDEVIVSDGETHVEVCVWCGEKTRYTVVNGTIDNARYKREHYIDFIQPHGKDGALFRRLYGEEGIKRVEEYVEGKLKAKKIAAAMIPEAREYLQTLKRTSFVISNEAK